MKNKSAFFLDKTKSSIKHLGVVAVIVSLSVMFSSLCIMSLLSLSDTLGSSIKGNTRSQLGGDVKTYVGAGNFDQANNEFEKLKQKGVVKNFSYLSLASNQYVLYQSESFGQEYVSVVGYANTGYPLPNALKFVSGKTDMLALKNDPSGVIMSEELAKRLGKNIGDPITLVSTDMFDTIEGKIVDLVSSGYGGSIYSIYVNEEKLKTIDTINSYYFYADGDQQKIQTALESSGMQDLTIQTYNVESTRESDSDRNFLLFIRGLSVLGLFIGSFGIASAVKVIVNKRKRELGILKVLGFLEKDVISMLLLEVSVISLLGAIAGVVLGHGFFAYLVKVLSSSPQLDIVLRSNFNWLAAVLAFGVSMVSSLLFAYISIKGVSGIKPIYALKEIDPPKTKREIFGDVVRFLLVAGIFVGISIFLAQSVVYGIGAVALVTVAIALFSLIFRALFFIILRIPVRTHNSTELAWNTIRLTYGKIIVSMIAIFAGMVAINLINTLVFTTKQIYKREFTAIQADISIVTDRHTPTDNAVKELLDSSSLASKYAIVLRGKNIVKDGEQRILGANIKDVDFYYKIIEGKQEKGGILMPDYSKREEHKKVGDIVTLTTSKGKTQLPITGFYAVDRNSRVSSLVYPDEAPMLTTTDFKTYFGNNFVEETWVFASKNNVEALGKSLGAVPNTFVVSSAKIEEMVNSVLSTLIQFAISVASLALLAGLILIVTVTVLDVMSRRRDFAIYKVIGFRQHEVTGMVLLEYSIMTIVTAIFASLLVYLITIFLNTYGKDLLQLTEKIYFDLQGGIIWSSGVVLMVLVLVFLVARRTLQVKPNEVLRYE